MFYTYNDQCGNEIVHHLDIGTVGHISYDTYLGAYTPFNIYGQPMPKVTTRDIAVALIIHDLLIED